MRGMIWRGGGAAAGRGSRNGRPGDACGRTTKALPGLLAGAALGACAMGSGGAAAYQQVSGTEGDAIAIDYSLPSMPHEMMRHHRGYSGVRYKLCTRDGTAKGAPWRLDGGEIDPEADYIGLCGVTWTLTSSNNYSKQLVLDWNTREDDRAEGDEYFWLDLTDPEVMRPGSGTWESHGGSHHVPLKITFQLIIRDDD